jgi:hypothetical protein
VGVYLDRQAGLRVIPGGGQPDVAQVPGTTGQFGEARQPAECSSPSDTSSKVSPPWRSSQRTSPGSTVPDLVAMTSPSSGVKPMVVSTHLPLLTAASDDPAPRWQVTTRCRSAFKSARIAPARRAAYACESP